MRKLPIVLLFAAAILVLSMGATASDFKKPVGTVSIESTSIALGIGVSWGEGVLIFQGNEYPFKVEGVSLADLGISRVSAVGEVYDLENVGDFAGVYSAAKAGIALAAGAEGLTMSNKHGVIINLRAMQQGVKLTLGVEGLVIKMK